MKLTPLQFVIALLGLIAGLVSAAVFGGVYAGTIVGTLTTTLAALMVLTRGESPPSLIAPAPAVEVAKPDLKVISGGQS